MTKLLLVVGARPNFMKIAPLVRAVERRAVEFTSVLVHTGQHYDRTMSDSFFRDLDLPTPRHHLGVGSGTHARQTAEVMLRFEPVLIEEKPDWVVVVGDVNSTLACALVAAKLGVRLAHVEAGLRSRDRTMPEEINRVLTDQLADLLFTTSEDADHNLLSEGVAPERIRFVGNVMIDALFEARARAEASDVRERLGLEGKAYGVVTLHRPSNTDDTPTLVRIVGALKEVSRRLPLVFPVHPRTRREMDAAGSSALSSSLTRTDDHRLRLIEPLGYLDFLRLVSGARLVLTDSGGLQEETTALGIPCLTLRENTERPITVESGTNRIVGTDAATIIRAAHEALDGRAGEVVRLNSPPLWDGKTADRILDHLRS